MVKSDTNVSIPSSLSSAVSFHPRSEGLETFTTRSGVQAKGGWKKRSDQLGS